MPRTASPYPKVICSILPRVFYSEALWDGAWNENGRNGVGTIKCRTGKNDGKSLGLQVRVEVNSQALIVNETGKTPH